MAKFQLCMFRRKQPPKLKKGDVLPSKLAGWERGLACVPAFGGGDVEYIIDENGNKLKKPPHNYKLLTSYSHFTIDTESPDGAF